MKRKKNSKTYFSFNLNIFKILSIILVIIFIYLIPLAIKSLIKIDKIECKSQFGNCDERIAFSVQKIGNYKDVNEQIEKRLNDDMQINSYLIQYKIPSTLKIELNIKTAKNAIYSNQTNKYYLISEDGLVLSLGDDTNLPIIKIDDPKLDVGNQIKENQKFAIEILNNMTFLYSINEGQIEKNSLIFKNTEGVTIIFPTEGNVNLLIGSLRLIISRLNDEAEGIRMNEIAEIDLRYKNPVLRKM